MRVLSLGLKYVPAKKGNQNDRQESLHRFKGSHRLRYHFRNSPGLVKHPFRERSSWEPPRASPDIESYLSRTRSEVEELPEVSRRDNMSIELRRALNTLSRDESLVIKAADKGSGIVVEDRSSYISDGLEHLSDVTIYSPVETDPTAQIAKAINKMVARMHDKGILDQVTKNFLTFREEPRTQLNYFLKNIHKDPIAVRPIVSGCSGPTERVSKFIDFLLQPAVPLIKSYVRDSSQLIGLLEETNFPADCTLATIDVRSLYLNIPHKEGIEAVLTILYREEERSPCIPPESLRDLLNVVLTQNYFQFADKMFHQIQGTAMGTKMALSYANLFMANLEERLLADYDVSPILWKRYLDDVFCVWPGNPDSFKEFVGYL